MSRKLEYKPLLYTTTIRNPERYKDFIFLLKKFDGQILTAEVVEKIEREAFKCGLYRPVKRIPKSAKEKWGKTKKGEFGEFALTDEEFMVMKSHPTRGEKIVINIKKLQMISEWVKSHHEKWDGTGYPDSLKGEQIPLPGRIIALADTYDAMTSTRPYRIALPHDVAMNEIKRCSGTQFDPTLAEIFLRVAPIIDEARKNPEIYYQRYSFLVKNIDFKIISEATQAN